MAFYWNSTSKIDHFPLYQRRSTSNLAPSRPNTVTPQHRTNTILAHSQHTPTIGRPGISQSSTKNSINNNARQSSRLHLPPSSPTSLFRFIFSLVLNECMTGGVDVYYILKRNAEGNREVLWRGNKTSVRQALYGLCLGDVIFFPESSRIGRGEKAW